MQNRLVELLQKRVLCFLQCFLFLIVSVLFSKGFASDAAPTTYTSQPIFLNIYQGSPLLKKPAQLNNQLYYSNELYEAVVDAGDPNGVPYLPIQDILKNLLRYQESGNCSIGSNLCTLQTSSGALVSFNFQKHTTHLQNTSAKAHLLSFDPGIFLVYANTLWIRADMLSVFFPLKIEWDPAQTQLNLISLIPIPLYPQPMQTIAPSPSISYKIFTIDLSIYQNSNSPVYYNDAFYPALKNTQDPLDLPYLPLTDFIAHLLGYTLAESSCTEKSQSCTFTSTTHYQLQLSPNNNTARVISNGLKKSVVLAPHTLISEHHQLWLRYDVLSQLLPLQSDWDAVQNNLNIVTSAPLNIYHPSQPKLIAAPSLQDQYVSTYTLARLSPQPPPPEISSSNRDPDKGPVEAWTYDLVSPPLTPPLITPPFHLSAQRPEYRSTYDLVKSEPHTSAPLASSTPPVSQPLPPYLSTFDLAEESPTPAAPPSSTPASAASPEYLSTFDLTEENPNAELAPPSTSAPAEAPTITYISTYDLVSNAPPLVLSMPVPATVNPQALMPEYRSTYDLVQEENPNAEASPLPPPAPEPEPHAPANADSLDEMSIGFNVEDTKNNSVFSSFFYDAYADEDQMPYISITKFFQKIMEYKLSGCSGDFTDCRIDSLPPGIDIRIDARKNQATINQSGVSSTYDFPEGGLLVKNNDLWLRADLWPHILPMKSQWEASFGQLTFTLDVPVYALLKAQRQHYNEAALEEQKLQSLREEQLQQYLQQPNIPANAQLRYQITANQGIAGSAASASTYRSLSLNFLGDIFKGTLQVSGSPLSGSNSINWNYAQNQKPYFYSAQIGDFMNNTSPFVGQMQLLNGLLFQKEPPNQSNMAFNYTGQTLPGTQVDIWRGSYLLKILTVGSSGTFSFSDVNAHPGDVYRLEYYYPNGTAETKTLVFPGTQSLLLNPKQWDVQLYTGQATQGIGSPSTGRYTQTLFRYGLLPKVTGGVGTYVVPTSTGSTVQAYFDLGWQTTPSLYTEFDKMLNASGYALFANYNGLTNNILQVYYEIVAEDSPLLNLPVTYTQLSSQSNAYKNFAVQDNYFLGRWRLLGSYNNSNLQTQTQFGASTYINRFFSPGVTVGTMQPQGQTTSVQSTLSNSTALTPANIIQTQANLNGNGGNNYTISYTYQPIGGTYSFGGTYSYTGGNSGAQRNSFGLSANWNINHYFSVNSTYSNQSFVVGVNFSDMVTLFSHTFDPTNYGTGTLYGKLLTPKIPGQAQTPIAGAVLEVNGNKATTDEQGNFVITGIAPNVKTYLTIDPDSLDASYIPAFEKIPLIFRPGSVINYNPPLNQTAGLDGYVMTDENIPKSAVVVAVRQDKSGFYRVSPVSNADGSFEFTTLTPGIYALELQGVDGPPPPLQVKIAPPKDWASNVLLYWKVSVPQDVAQQH